MRARRADMTKEGLPPYLFLTNVRELATIPLHFQKKAVEIMGKRQRLTALYALVQASFWMSFCVAVSFAAVYLQSLGYDNTHLGVILAAGNLLGAVLGPAFSALIDRNPHATASRLIPPLLAVQAAALALLLLFPRRGVLTALSYVLYVAFSLSVNSLNLKLYVDFSHRGLPINYGVARGMGSLAYVLLSMGLGILAERTSIRALPMAGLALCAMQAAAHVLLCRRLPAGQAALTQQRQGVTLAAFLRKNRRFSLLLLGTALLFFAHNTVCNFLINITRHVGGDTEDMGYINSFMAAMEIPVMLLFSRLFGRRSTARLLRLAFCCFVLKTAAVAAAPSIPALYAAFLLQAPSFALYTAAIVPYTERTVAYEDSAKAQSLAFSMTTLGSVLASAVSGWMLDRLPVPHTLWIACLACALGAGLACFGVERKKTLQ